MRAQIQRSTELKALLLIVSLTLSYFTCMGEDEIAEKFRGEWLLIAYETPEGKRTPPTRQQLLKITAHEVIIKWDLELDKPRPGTTYISESGRMWVVPPGSKHEIELGRVKFVGDELHLVNSRRHGQIIYRRYEEKKGANQTVETNAPPGKQLR